MDPHRQKKPYSCLFVRAVRDVRAVRAVRDVRG